METRFSAIGSSSRKPIWISWGAMMLIPGMVFASFDLSQMPSRIPVKNKYYSITEVHASKNPGMLRFQVHSPHATYEIEGFLPLEKLLREIEVIERVTHQESGGGFLDGASDSVEATMVGIGNLVGHPIDSAKGLGSAAGKLGRSLGGMFRKKDEGEKSSFGETMMGSGQREVAKSIGADVYTRNPHLQSLIRGIARSRMGGRGAVMVVSFLIPVAALASVAMTAGSINSSADQIVNDTSRVDLYRQNYQALQAMGFEAAEVKAFLDLPYLTPREQTYFRFYLETLKKTEGFGAIFQSMLSSSTEWDALRKLHEAQIAAGANPGQFAKIWSYPEGLGVLELSGRMAFITAYDDLDADDLGQKVLARITALRAQHRMPVEIRNGGRITDDFRAKARRADIQLKPWVFFDHGDKHEDL